MTTDAEPFNPPGFLNTNLHTRIFITAASISLGLAQGCTTASLSSKEISGIDSKFRNQRWAQGHMATNSSRTSSPSVGFYQKVLGKTLGSHCSFYPSDSAWNQKLHQNCGSGVAIFRSMARFYLEPDAATLGLPLISKRERIYFADLPQNCHFF
jgi:hypothetical protein